MITLRAHLIDPEHRRQSPPTWSGIVPLRYHFTFAVGLIAGLALGAVL